MKDVLQHWPVDDIKRFVDRNRHRFRYLLLTNDVTSVHCPPELVNSECALGAWRTLDLERPPFGYRAAWRHDFDIRGEWTKRITLLASPWRHPTMGRRDSRSGDCARSTADAGAPGGSARRRVTHRMLRRFARRWGCDSGRTYVVGCSYRSRCWRCS